MVISYSFVNRAHKGHTVYGASDASREIHYITYTGGLLVVGRGGRESMHNAVLLLGGKVMVGRHFECTRTGKSSIYESATFSTGNGKPWCSMGKWGRRQGRLYH